MSGLFLRLVPVRYIVVAMTFFGITTDFILRGNISLTIVAMVNHTAVNSSDSTNQKDGPFVWDENTVGLILGSFYYGNICTSIIGGRAAEMFSVKYVFGVSLLLTGILTFLIPSAAWWTSGALVAIRIVMGLALGMSVPSGYALLRSWAPPNERALVVSLTMSASNIGNVITMPMASAIVKSLGWEAVFYIQGSFAVVWFILWVPLVYNSPEEHIFITDEERDYIIKSIGTGKAKKSPPLPWREILSSLPFWALATTNMCNNWGYLTLLSDLPQYFTKIFDKDISSSAVFTSLPFLGAYVIAILYGAFSDWLRKRNIMSVTNIRRIAQFLSQTMTAACLVAIALLGRDEVLVEVLLFVGMGLYGCGYSGWHSIPMDMAPNYAGTLSGIINTFGCIPGFVAPAVVGALTEGHETVDRWRWCFLIPATLMVFDTIIFFMFGSAQEQSWNRKYYHTEDGERREKAAASPEGLENEDIGLELGRLRNPYSAGGEENKGYAT